MNAKDKEAQEHGVQQKRNSERRNIERRKPKRGVNVRHDDEDEKKPKRVRRGEQKPKEEELKAVGTIQSLDVELTQPLKIKADLELSKIMVMVGANATGKTFILIVAWCCAYITNALVTTPQLDVKDVAQWCFDHSFTEHKMEGSIAANFVSGVRIAMRFSNGQVIEAEVSGMEEGCVPEAPTFMSSQLRTFDAISMYLKMRKQVHASSEMEMLSAMLESYKLYDVTYVERLIAGMPRQITENLVKYLKNYDFEIEKEGFVSIDVDLDRGDFFLLTKNGERKYMTQYGSGHQAIMNMALGSIR